MVLIYDCLMVDKSVSATHVSSGKTKDEQKKNGEKIFFF